MLEEKVYNNCIENMKKYFNTIKENFPEYEERMSQKKMIFAILTGYKNDKNSIIEAPTGTGKSLGYLLPFLSIWEQFQLTNEEINSLIENNKPIKKNPESPKLVIATNTIALQEQLMKKDIPFFKKTLGVENLQVELVKGRNNFICLSKLYEIIDNFKSSKSMAEIFDSIEEFEEWDKIKNYLPPNVYEGDRSKFPITISNSLWNKIACESDNCAGLSCPNQKECFFYKNKQKLKEADILVTNHSLFFADLSIKIDTKFTVDDLVLPKYDYLVFDEAHHLEDVASDFLGKSVSIPRFARNLKSISKKVTRGDFSNYFSDYKEYQTEIENICNTIQFDVDILFSDISLFVGNNESFRLLSKNKNFVDISHITSKLDMLYNLLIRCCDEIEFEEVDLKKMESFCKRINDLKIDFEFLINQENSKFSYWIDSPNRENRYYFTTINAAPVDVSNLLSENLFKRQNSIVLASATLGTNNLNYIAQRLGVDNYIGAMFHSPFNYEQQSKIYVPVNTVHPNNENYQTYIEEEIFKIIEKSKGRTLVLFTSYKLMNSVYSNLSDSINGLGYNALKQGDLPRTPLIEEFRKDTSSVLFATSSYWEGIDVPGESLSTVIITRLPFEVPNKPVILSRMESVTEKGGNSFLDYQVPNAIMKFKQGVGRLIRTSTDKGIVAVLDNRLLEMRYGITFLESLPKMPITRNIEDIQNLLN